MNSDYKYISLASIVLIYTLQSVCMQYAIREHYLTSTAVLLSECIKLIVAFAIYLHEQRSLEGLVDTLFGSDSQKWHVSFVSVLYLLQNNALYLSMNHLDFGVYQVSSQLKLFTTAFFSILLLKCALSPTKWLSIGMLFVGIGLVSFEQDTSEKPGLVIGLVAMAVHCLISGLASTWFEKILKNSSASLAVRNIQLAVFGIVPGVLFSLAIMDFHTLSKFGFFYGYTLWTWAAIFLHASGGLVVAAVLRYSDGITKGYCTGLSVVLSSLLSVPLLGNMIDPKALMGILLILLSIYLYSSSQTPKTDTPEKLTSRPFFLPVFSKQQVRWIWIYALLATITTSVFVFFEQDEQGMHATGWGPFGIKHGSWMATVEEHLYGTRKRAYMFYAMNPDYACNTLISIDRLKKAGADPKIDFALIYSDNIGEQYIQKFKNLGVKMIKKTPWNQEEPEQWLAHYSDSLTKLYVFEDLGYDKIVFIDSDTLIMRNLDHLFLLPPIETYWAPRAYWLNQPFITSVLLVVDPKFGQLQKLRDWLKHEKGNVFDMDTLNLMWINKAGILPEEYTILDKDFEAEYIPEHETRFSSAFVIHFSSFLGKPWYTPHEQMVRDPHRNPILYRVFDMYWEERNRVCKFE